MNESQIDKQVETCLHHLRTVISNFKQQDIYEITNLHFYVPARILNEEQWKFVLGQLRSDGYKVYEFGRPTISWRDSK